MTSLTAAGFLFDMDGTLVDSTAVVEEVWAEMCDRLGMSYAAVMATSHGRQSRATLAQHAPWLQGQELDAAAAWIAEAEETRLDGVVEVPGAADLLRALAEAPIALVTSAHAALAEARMSAAGVPLPRLRVTAESVSASKPDPEGYLLGARLLGLRPADCLAFEDADAGIAAVRAAGMPLVAVGSLTDTAADVRVADLRGVTVSRTGDSWTLSF